MDKLHELRVLFYNPIYPHSTGAFHRTFNIVKLSAGSFEKATIYAPDENEIYRCIRDGVHLVQEKKYSSKVDKYHYYLQMLLSKNYCERCSPEALKGMDEKSVLQIEGPYFYNLLKASRIKNYVLDEHNVYWELHDFPALDLKNRIYNRMAYMRNKAIEIEAVRKASHVLVCSDIDKLKLIDEIPDMDDSVSVIPNCVDYDEFSNYLKSSGTVGRDSGKGDGSVSSGVQKVLYVGTFNYSPNVDAAHVICEKIAPSFDASVRFVIVGKNPPRIRKPDNVEFLGYVEDLKKQIMESDICIAPIQYGSGTRFKILEYMAIGRPVVSTSKGAEGLEYTEGKDIVIENNLDRFSERIKELLQNPGNLGRNAQDLIARKYDWKIYRESLHKIYNSVM